MESQQQQALLLSSIDPVIYKQSVEKAQKQALQPIPLVQVCGDVLGEVVWNKEHTHVLAVSFVREAVKGLYTYALEKSNGLLPLPWQLKLSSWVTLVPEVWLVARNHLRNAIHSSFKTNLDENTTCVPMMSSAVIESTRLRIVELLGLLPNSANNTMVEMWVRPADLIRACRNPTSPQQVTCSYGSKDIPLPTEKADLYKQGFPWTQLGYTYDYDASNISTQYGASEFIINNNWSEELSGNSGFVCTLSSTFTPECRNVSGTGQQATVIIKSVKPFREWLLNVDMFRH